MQVLNFVIWDFSFLSIILTTITITYTLHHHSHHHCHLQPSPPSPQALTSSITSPLTSSTHLFHHLTPSPQALTSSITSPPHLKHSPLPSPHPLTSSTHLFNHLTPHHLKHSLPMPSTITFPVFSLLPRPW